MTKLRRVLASLAVLALSAGAGAPVFAAERVTFLIDWLPAGDKAVPYLGVQQGVFAEEGLDVVIQSGRGSSDVVNDISKKDGAGAFEKALPAKTWKWTAEAQNIPLDKLDPETAVDRSFIPK